MATRKGRSREKRCTNTASTEASTENSAKSESVKRPRKKKQPPQQKKQQPQKPQPLPPPPRRTSTQQQQQQQSNNNVSNSSSKTSDSSNTAKDTKIKRRLKLVTTRKKTSQGKANATKTASLDKSESSSKSAKRKKKAATKSDATQDVSAKTIKKKEHSIDGTQMEGVGGGTKNYRHESRQKRDQSIEHGTGGADLYDKQLSIFVKDTLKIGIPKLVKDFHEARATAPKNMPKTAFEKNPDKNRYKDVICMDATRVALTWPPENPNDYVHANLVKIRGEEKYICTQGPTSKTVEDFWRLVFQEKCKGIVMLTEVMELGKKKCEQYWPKIIGDSMTFGLCTIVNKKVTEVEKMLISTQLEVTANDETLKCEHVLWTGWPDRGVPDNYLATLRLIRKMAPFSPCLVHCSAGIGRTGTIVGLDLCQKTLQAGEKADMHEIVKELRKYRHGSVQTDVQFVFMHAVILKLAENRKAATKDQLKPFFDEYAAYVATRQ